MTIDNRVVQAGSPRRFITTLQRQLVRENPSALPQHGIDGTYGAETMDWVSRFQERKGLTVDGIAGPETLGQLRADIIYRPGDSGNGVELLQEDLMYFTVDLSPYGADGDYGATTEQGVRDFQYFNFMTVDGIAGPDTFYKIDELYETILIQEGDEGAHVRRIQEQLNEQEEVNLSISVDGGYGTETVDAVEQFQEASDLNIDGIVGPYTMVALDIEATQTLNYEEIQAALDAFGSESAVLNNSKVNDLIEILESNNAYRNTTSYSLNNEETAGVSFSYDDSEDEIYLISGVAQNNELLGIYAYFDQTGEELLGYGTIEFSGLLYSDEVTVNIYDVDGELLETVEDTRVELDNVSLIIAQEVSEAYRELQSNLLKAEVTNIDLDDLNYAGCRLLWYGNSILLSRFAVVAFSLGGLKAALVRVGISRLVQYAGEQLCEKYKP
ncbi:peptidoglycan-binding domain-containing protein [Oceanobacillus locisalsi]|uniref:Peptidoglycan-binding protein n=1 Tax=Oceanobacillus locisalsi TaxID=546107 RepID=A0ABW3NAU0_9BACI